MKPGTGGSLTARSGGAPEAPLLARTARDFYDLNRGGGPLSRLVSQRLAAYVAAEAWRFGLSPASLTLLSLGGSFSAAGVLVTSAWWPNWAHGLAVMALWQASYVLDCADGQLARGTGRTSPAGARLDVLCDFVGQALLLTGLLHVLERHGVSGVGAGLAHLFALLWASSLLLSTLNSTSPAQGSPRDPRRAGAMLHRVLGSLRDPALPSFVFGFMLCTGTSPFGALLILGALNSLALTANIRRSVLASLRS